MTDQELIDYYADLLIIQYRGKPKAYATIQALAKMVISNQIALSVQNAFNVDTAIGVQLDVLGKYIGASRTAVGPSGAISLNDDDYRTLLKIVIIKNNNGSSLATIQDLFNSLLPNQVRIIDNQNMTLQYIITDDIGSDDLHYVLANGGYLPKPMGVGLTVVFVPSFDTTYFGFRTYGAAASGKAPLNSYPFYQTTYPWITYGD